MSFTTIIEAERFM